MGSHFYASIQGSRGEATKQGTAESGIDGHIRGWDVGIAVRGYVDEDGKDRFYVTLTSGSNGHRTSRFIGSFTEQDLEEKGD
jgi:hypothetical protein